MPAVNAPQTPTYKVAFVTLGCAKNEVDTNKMRAIVESAPALTTVDDVDDADVVVLNTCSFLTQAVQEGVDTALELALSKTTSDKRPPVVMTGCIPSRYGTDALADAMGEVAAFLRVDEENGIAEAIARVLGIDSQAPLATPPRVVDSATAYVKISDGCDRFCTFCAIPYIRGRYYSRPAEEILSEVAFLAERGVREVVLIGQDTSVWGQDLEGKPTLANLLVEVARVMEPFDGWVRVLYLQPEGITDELVSVIRDTPQVVKYIDMPLQHCSHELLERMNRQGDKASFLSLVERLRDEIPGLCLRTTVMVGFPGESESDFDELCSFVTDASFDYHAVFAFSPEEGTAAADMPEQIEPQVKLQREQDIIDLTESIGFASAADRVGNVYRVFVDGIEEDETGAHIVGRTYFQSPDSDGVVHIEDGDVEVGSFYNVEITDSACYELFGRIVNS